jgi:hypothetical protein
VRQVHLVQRNVVDLDVHAEPCVLHRVAGEVLHARHHVLLQAAGERCTELAHVERVLAVGLLRATPRRVAQHVDAHCAGEVGADGGQLQADRFADAFLQRRVPRGAAGHRHGEGGGVADHCAAWAIAETDATETDSLDLATDETLRW